MRKPKKKKSGKPGEHLGNNMFQGENSGERGHHWGKKYKYTLWGEEKGRNKKRFSGTVLKLKIVGLP